MADPMVYPLLFPYGEAGHDCAASHHFNPSKKVTFREFYRFRLQMRNQPVNPPNRNTYSESVPHGFSVLHNAGKLFQQYLVDAYVKIESNELWWYKSNMQQIRQSGYPNLLNYLERRARMESSNCRVGTVQILPPGFRRGHRYQKRQYLDAMTIVARHGKPDLFITFTCNPTWPEITTNLLYKQKWQNRPDLVCRVFHTKFLEFLDDI
ncbi:hypothetical protein YQE_12665, partial [Dendroctonus ponderosae]